MSRRSSSARSSRYHPPQGSFLLRVLREVFDPYKKSMLVLDSSAVEWSRPCRTTRSGHGPRRLRAARWLPLRSEGASGEKECVSRCRSWWVREYYKKNIIL